MSLAILNVGAGDTKLTFDKDKPEERARAAKIVTDMLKRGFALLVQIGEKNGKPHYRRATKFDPKTCEYIVMGTEEDVEAEKVVTKKIKRGGRGRRLPAATTKAVGVARSAGGMSDRAGSIELENLERFDNFSGVRDAIKVMAEMREDWAGIPMPLDDQPIVMEPKFPRAAEFMEQFGCKADESWKDVKVRNRFYSAHRRCDIGIWETKDGKIEWGMWPAVHSFDAQLSTMGSSVAWGVEQEAKALQLLAELLPHHAFKKYLMTGMFIESSKRSRVSYVFRKLRPTIAITMEGSCKILASLCMHPIAYYAGSWAGAMCPTDDVIAHLMMMRGDEPMYWRRCNQHPAYRPEAGI